MNLLNYLPTKNNRKMKAFTVYSKIIFLLKIIEELIKLYFFVYWLKELVDDCYIINLYYINGLKLVSGSILDCKNGPTTVLGQAGAPLIS